MKSKANSRPRQPMALRVLHNGGMAMPTASLIGARPARQPRTPGLPSSGGLRLSARLILVSSVQPHDVSLTLPIVAIVGVLAAVRVRGVVVGGLCNAIGRRAVDDVGWEFPANDGTVAADADDEALVRADGNTCDLSAMTYSYLLDLSLIICPHLHTRHSHKRQPTQPC